MLAAATTAADAPDIVAGPPPAGIYTDSFGGWRTGQFFTFAFPDVDTSQWVRFRVPWRSAAWALSARFFSLTGTFQTTLYASTNPDEVGATLEQIGQWPYAGISIGYITATDTVWLYVQVTQLAPYAANTDDLGYGEVAITLRAQAQGRTTVTAGHHVVSPRTAHVFGWSYVSAGEHLVGALRVRSTTLVRIGGPVFGAPQPVIGGSACAVVHRPTIPGDVVGVPEPARGHTRVRLTGTVVGTPDDVIGLTVVAVDPGGDIHAMPAPVNGVTRVLVRTTVELTDNPPIEIAFESHAELRMILPEEPLFLVGNSPYRTMPLVGNSPHRTMPLVSLDLPVPIIAAGKPWVPRWHAQTHTAGTARQGSKHIRATDPAPAWDPTIGGWIANPPDRVWDGRWVVDDLPDPPDGGYYWLGDPSYSDGTGNYKGGRTRWAPHASTPHAPEWRSFFPYKPSVRAVDSYLPDGGVVHHPKGVHFNSEFVEHMWADFGGARRQPFTWVIAGMIAGYPSTHYRHFVLDAGRNPDKVHFPRLSVSGVYQPHTIHDDLDYRSLIAYSRDGQLLSTRHDFHGPHHVRARVDPHRGRPKMFFGVFNGAQSLVGAYGPNSRRIAQGRVDDGPKQHHRFYVLGRAQNAVDQGQASHMLIFEIRYWRHALSRYELNLQYHQLASTYHFNRYRRV